MHKSLIFKSLYIMDIRTTGISGIVMNYLRVAGNCQSQNGERMSPDKENALKMYQTALSALQFDRVNIDGSFTSSLHLIHRI